MIDRQAARDFLRSRRAQIQPEQVGLPADHEERRVPGLRREEVAVLAGVSLDYYVRLEQGHLQGASDSVLFAIANALMLNEAERTHLFNLARPATGQRPVVPNRSDQQVRDSVRRLIDGMQAAAMVQNAQQEIVATNALGELLYAPAFEGENESNIARFIFLDPRAQEYYVDWETARRTSAAMLRLEVGRNPLDEGLTALIGELSTRSPTFRKDWASQHVHLHQTGIKSFRHPQVGRLDVEFNAFDMPGSPGLMVVTYNVAPDAPTAEAWALMASLATSTENRGSSLARPTAPYERNSHAD